MTTKKIITPLTYYGGKQKLAKAIIPLIPPHKTYVEPFVVGVAIFWSKPVTEADFSSMIGDSWSMINPVLPALKKSTINAIQGNC